MKLYIVRVNGGLNDDRTGYVGPETVSFTVKDSKLIPQFVSLENVTANPEKHQMVFFNEAEKALFNEFQFLGAEKDEDSRSLKGLSFTEWQEFFNQRIGCFVTLKSLDLV